MEHSVLTSTPLFQILKQQEENTGMENAYNEFIEDVCGVCCNSVDLKVMTLTLTYTEIELQHMMVNNPNPHPNAAKHLPYIQKALTFISKMMVRLRHCHQPLPPPPFAVSSMENAPPPVASTLHWTGNAIDLVEIIYGINEMGCINGGKVPLKDLASVLYSFFGVDSKDCYRFYTDIKRRKNESRTYFLDKMKEKLNEKMRRDDEAERMRR